MSLLLVYNQSVSVLSLTTTREGVSTGPTGRVDDIGLPLQPVRIPILLTWRMARACILDCGFVLGTRFAEASMTRAESPRLSERVGGLIQALCGDGGLVLGC
jgi:hypothetical protein